MTNINRDLDRYLKKRKEPQGTFTVSFDSPTGSTESSWWNKIAGSKLEPVEDTEELTPEERVKLESMEGDLRETEERVEAVEEYEDELEDDQERKVSLYHQVLGLFRKRHHPSENEDIDEIEMPEETLIDSNTNEDFRALARIYLRWMERLPKRVKDEFLESEDYDQMTEILTRRGVARKRY